MKTIEQIREQLSHGKYDLSAHAFDRSIERKIMFFEIEEAGTNSVIIEDYPEDKISPSCLLLGYSNAGKPLHILVSRADIDYLKIITVYEPDADIFDNYIKRR
jgi:hypothetical protein